MRNQNAKLIMFSKSQKSGKKRDDQKSTNKSTTHSSRINKDLEKFNIALGKEERVRSMITQNCQHNPKQAYSGPNNSRGKTKLNHLDYFKKKTTKKLSYNIVHSSTRMVPFSLT